MKVISGKEEVIKRIIRGERKRRGKEILDNTEVTKEQQQTLTDYNRYLVVQGRTLGTREEYLRRTIEFVPYLKGKPFEGVIREEFTEFFYSKRDKKAATKQRNYAELHRFYGWLSSKEEEDERKYIRILEKERYIAPKGERHIIKAETLPTEEEIQQIIKFAGNPRDKCMIAMSYDLGTRPKELLALNVGDVAFDEYGAVVTVGEHGKTGARTLRLILSLPYLRQWLESHPYRDNKDAALFIGLGRNQFGNRIEPQTLRHVFKEAAKLAGIDKRLWTYLLRHASITREACNGLGDQQLKVFYGWSPSSRMLEVYSHLTSDDVNKTRLEQAGIIKPKEHKGLEIRKCPRCSEVNPVTADFCQKCSSVLDEAKYRKQQTKEDILKEELQKRDERLSEIESRISMSQRVQFVNPESEMYSETDNPEMEAMREKVIELNQLYAKMAAKETTRQKKL